MDKSFDFERVLKNHAILYKSKPPTQSVRTRLENSLQHRRSSRLTLIDSKRNLSQCESPLPDPKSVAQMKAEHRKQKLQQWKEEKNKRKKQAVSQKIKPFLTGIPHVPLRFVPPPPVPVRPSSSGRVTRSQAARAARQISQPTTSHYHSEPSVPNTASFAPLNATFKPPVLKKDHKLPYVSLAPLKTTKTKNAVSLNPGQPQNNRYLEENKSRHSERKTNSRKIISVEPKATKKLDAKPKAKAVPKKTIQTCSSSSKSDLVKPLGLRGKTYFVTHPSQSSSECNSIQSTINKTVPNKVKPDSPILISKKSKESPKHTTILTLKNIVPKSESASEQKLRSPKSPLDAAPMTPEQIVQEAKRISPCVTLSRGKDNARKEMKKKLEEGLLDEDMSDIANVGHFRRQLAFEIKRMTELCETWDQVLEQTVLPDSIQECVLTAVGQARLLMSQKLQQFASLVERCARPDPGAALVTPADLHGFWDMVFMQVENVNVRFKKLEEVRARGWTEDAPLVVQKKKALPKVNKTKPAAGGGGSRIRDMIAAKRKALKQQPAAAAAAAERTFDGGFFSVSSPVRSAPATPNNKSTLLKAVLSNEANKSVSKNSASFAMLRASVLAKNTECDGVSPLPLTPVPCPSATPGRSILKQTTAKKSSKKSIKMVLFDKSDTAFNTSLDSEPNQDNRPEHTISSVNHQQKKDDETTDTKDRPPVSIDIDDSDKENYKRRSRRRVTQQDQDAVESPKTPATRHRRATAAAATPLHETNEEPGARSGGVKTRSQRRSMEVRRATTAAAVAAAGTDGTT